MAIDGVGGGEPGQPGVRVWKPPRKLPVLQVDGDVEPVTDDDVRAGWRRCVRSAMVLTATDSSSSAPTR